MKELFLPPCCRGLLWYIDLPDDKKARKSNSPTGNRHWASPFHTLQKTSIWVKMILSSK